jgi:hypothetical protein
MTPAKLLWESVIVGLICLAAGAIVFYALGTTERRKTKGKGRTGTRPAVPDLYVGLFLTGFLGHAFMELAGLNPRLHKLTGVWLW